MKYFKGKRKKQSYFEGWYFKQTNNKELLAFIPSIHIDESGTKKAFIQIISTDGSYQAEFSYKDTYISDNTLFIRIGGNEFSKQGLKLNINLQAINIENNSTELLQCSGKLYYTHLTPCKVISWVLFDYPLWNVIMVSSAFAIKSIYIFLNEKI